jgi:hypothetical protein
VTQYFHVNYGLNATGKYNFSWDIINHLSSVVITAAEGREPSIEGGILEALDAPERIIGDAQYTVHNIAPYDGGVTFRIEIDWGALLNTWVCITVFDDSDYQGIVW